MSTLVLMLWLLNIIADTVGQLSFKAGALTENHYRNLKYYLNILCNRWVLLGIICYIFEFFLWLGFLSIIPLSNGVLLGSFNIVVVTLAGRYFFQETISYQKLLGVILVTAGVIIVGVNT